MGRPPSDLDDYLEWQQRLESRKESGLSLDVFCLQEGVSKSTYYRWADRIRNGIPESMTAEKAGRAQEIFEQDPLEGHLFLFVNRNRDHLKLLFWDHDGYCIWHKRLERGTFQLLTVAGAEGIELSYAQLVRLLGGLDLTTGRRRKRYRRQA